jgi:hypothetical protein
MILYEALAVALHQLGMSLLTPESSSPNEYYFVLVEQGVFEGSNDGPPPSRPSRLSGRARNLGRRTSVDTL